jgi:hypothetical protein
MLHVMSRIAGWPVLPPDALEAMQAPASVLIEHHAPVRLCL